MVKKSVRRHFKMRELKPRSHRATDQSIVAQTPRRLPFIGRHHDLRHLRFIHIGAQHIDLLADPKFHGRAAIKMPYLGGIHPMPARHFARGEKKKDRGAFIYEPLDNDGPEVWRRAIYRFVVRGGERIMMDSFDCPDPSVATPQRTVSNTPVQALTLLNNDFVIRQAGLLAQRLRKESGDDAGRQIERAYRLLYGRGATERELKLGREFLAGQTLANYTRALINANEFVYVP